MLCYAALTWYAARRQKPGTTKEEERERCKAVHHLQYSTVDRKHLVHIPLDPGYAYGANVTWRAVHRQPVPSDACMRRYDGREFTHSPTCLVPPEEGDKEHLGVLCSCTRHACAGPHAVRQSSLRQPSTG